MGLLSWIRKNFTHAEPCAYEPSTVRLEPGDKIWAEWHKSRTTNSKGVFVNECVDVLDRGRLIAFRPLIDPWTGERFEVPSRSALGVLLDCQQAQRIFLVPYNQGSNPAPVYSFPLLQMLRSDLQYEATQNDEPPFYYLDAYKFGPVAGAKTGLVPYPPPEGVGETHLLGSDCFWADYDAGYHKMQYTWNSVTVFRYDRPLLPYVCYIPASDERFADSICILMDNKLHYFVKGHHLGCDVLNDWTDKRMGVAYPVRYIGYYVI